MENLEREFFSEVVTTNGYKAVLSHWSRFFEWNEKIVGVISICSHDGKPMIGWLGVSPELRGKGVGRLLLEKVESELKKWGYKDLRVETVGECTPIYKPYAETLKFYKSSGFEIEKQGRLRHNMGYKWRYSTLKKKLLN